MVIYIVSFFSFSQLFSDTIIVDTTGAGDYTNIQDGINAAIDGDTVLVYPGIYYENINYIGKNITVASLYLITQNNFYIDSTIIDGNQNGSVVTFNSGEDTTAILCGFTIQNGSGTSNLGNIRGGGIFVKNSNPQINSCTICNNIAEIGAGIHCRYSNILLENTRICFNHAFYHGGGIYLRDDSTINFSSVNRCNIYNNYAAKGCDFCSYEVLTADIIVDTFTVLEPDEYFIQTQPENNFTCDILNGWLEPVNQNLYVSQYGDNTNSGLSINEPLKSISWALTKIVSDSTHPNTIHLSNGEYSSSVTNEMFPLNCRSYVSIIGEYEENTILDGENISSIIWSTFGDNHLSIENLTIQNGYSNIGGGISFQTNSSPILKNVTLKNNYAVSGGAFYCLYDSNPIFDNVTIKNNISDGSICRFYINCNPILINCQIFNNICTEGGSGGISLSINCNIILIDCLITENSTDDPYLGYGGGLWLGSDDSELINATICSNYASISGGGIYAPHNTFITNSILYNNSINQIGLTDDSELTVVYSDIQDGEAGIGGAGTIHWLEGNIDSLPQFVGGDPFSYELTEGSPCIDAGTPDTTGLNLPATDLAGNPRIYNGRIDIGAYEYQGVGIDEPDTSFINNIYLFNNTPNPFKESTTISFISADYERIKDYTLSIYNTKGQLVKRYYGEKDDFWVRTEIVWDGKDEQGKRVAPGTYLYKLEYNGNAVVRKMVKIR